MTSSVVDTSPWWSKLSYSYVWPLLVVGSKRAIQLGDLPPLGTHDDIHKVTGKLEKVWSETDVKHKKKGSKNGDRGKRALWWALSRAYTREIVWAGVFAFGESIAYLLQPLLLRWFVLWLGDEDQELWRGIVIALFIGVVSVYQTLVHHVLYYFTMRLGWNLRIGMIGLIHQKLLTLNTSAVSKFSAGTVINLISTDVLRFDTCCTALHFIWTTPIEVIVCAGFMVSEVGWAAAMSGIGVLVLAIILTFYLGKRFGVLRRRTAGFTDKRVKLTSEVLSSMLSVKAYGWEEPFLQKLGKLRKDEAASILRSQRLRATNASMYFAATAIAALATFVVVWAQKRELDLSTVVFILAFLQVLRIGIGKKLTRFMETTPECLVAVDRMQKFLEVSNSNGLVYPSAKSTFVASPVEGENGATSPNGNQVALKPQGEGGEQGFVELSNVTISWPMTSANTSSNSQNTQGVVKDEEDPRDGEQVILKNVTLQAHRPSLISVYGPVGSGKSTLFAALTGEAVVSGGSVSFSDVALAPQDACIFPGTLKSNIVFGMDDDQVDMDYYKLVLEACALEKDIEQLPDGEYTEIGEKGINLSGGQKARIGLARCMYARRSVCLLDDPLAAVDPHVADELFSKAIAIMKTRSIVILVTHHPHFAVQADNIYVIENNTLVPHTRVEFEDIIAHHLTEEPQNKKETALASTLKNEEDDSKDAGKEEDKGLKTQERKGSRLVVEEDRQTGVVSFATYIAYFTSSGRFLATFIFLNFFISQGLLFATDYWLQRWADLEFESQQRPFNVHVYVVLGLITMAFALLGAMLFFMAITKANSKLHFQSLSSVLNAPQYFFSANPLGRILNRFSSDLGQVDELLTKVSFDTIQLFVMCLGSLVFACVAIPYLAIGIPPLFYVLYRIRQFAVKSLRDLKRMDGTSRSPVYEMFSASMFGLQVIRAYNNEQQRQEVFLSLLQRNATTWFWWLLANRWLGFRLDLLSATVALVACLIGVGLKGVIDRGVLGVALVYVIALSGVFQYTVRLSAQVETYMTSVERIRHYIHNIPQEGEYVESLPAIGDGEDTNNDDDDDGGLNNGVLLPQNNRKHQQHHTKQPQTPSGLTSYVSELWPSSGSIRVVDLCARYRENNGDVLHSISCNIPSGCKVGLTGRTGSGKSTFSQVLIGTVIISGGHVEIDGVNTLQVPKQKLRGSISYIPQDPRLFSSTVAFNLDPTSTRSEKELKEALQAVQLHHVALDDEVDANGSNFSVGEKQLLSLARAMLCRARIVVMDEATANIDYDTDHIIQKTLREHPSFSSATLIVIAHRLKTIADADIVINLDAGEVENLELRSDKARIPFNHQNDPNLKEDKDVPHVSMSIV
eukprot:m.12141 g.12141  ORF g.12141 m.12141 type:complete len:1358 (-) comp7126_c0_seq2:2775-6848(-)